MAPAAYGYRVIDTVHDGLYGPVLRAQEPDSGRVVALQRFLGGQAERALSRMEAQVAALRRLSHKGIRKPLETGLHPEGGLFVAWEWSDGQPLQLPAASARQALTWTQQVAAILEDAHRQSVSHLFLRPSQILTSGSDAERRVCTVLGLGVTAALGLPVQTLGTQALEYLAPEIRSAERRDSRAADVFSLGRMLRGLLGLSPGSTPGDLHGAQVTLASAQRPVLSDLLDRMLSVTPESRPSIADVVVSIDSILRSAEQSPLVRETPLPQPVSDSDALIGQEFGNFRVLRRLGQGGMGAVYEAQHKLIKSRAALKVMKQSLTSPEYARRFLDEARAVNIVEHPGLVSIFEFGQRQDGLLYIVMEHLSGSTLEELIAKRKEPLREAEILPIALQLGQALEAAHKKKVVHRDLKPSNVMLVADAALPSKQRVKILDFGIAKLKKRDTPTGDDRTEVGVAMGTPAYMAPEQHQDASGATGKADVFSFGVLLFEALTGQLPFGEASTMSVLMRPAPSVRSIQRRTSKALSELIDSMLQADADVRPPMAEVVARLERLAARRAWRTPLLLLAGGASAAALAGTSAFLLTRPPSLAEIEARYSDTRLRASTVLLKAVQAERPLGERLAAVQALGKVRDPTYRNWLLPLVSDGDRQLACAASGALGDIGDPSDGAAIVPLLDHPDGLARRACATSALLKLRTSREFKDALALALALLQDPRLQGQAEAVPVLAELTARLLASGQAVLSGESVRARLMHPSLQGSEQLQYLELAATRSEGDAAVIRLRQIATAPDRPTEEHLGALASLIWLGQATAEERKLFLDAAEQPGAHQLLAAGLRVHADGIANCGLFWDILARDNEAGARRQEAALSLARCGVPYAERLERMLDRTAGTPLLQIAVARSLLLLVGPDWQRGAEAQQRFARSYDSSGPLEDRLAYLDSLTWLPEDHRTPAIARILREDGEERVRGAAAQFLKAEHVRGVLASLAEELADARGDVYQSALRAAGSLLAVVESPPLIGVHDSLRRRLSDRLRGPVDPAEEVVLRSLLLRCGEREQAALLRSRLPLLGRAQHLLAIRLSDARGELVSSSLADSDPEVRLAAARHRVSHELFDRETRYALTELLARSGQESLRAYLLLRAMGASAEQPKHLTDLLARREPLPVRWEVVLLLGQLPIEEALPLLWQASTDPAAVVRHAAIRSAWALYQKTADPRPIDLILSLSSDPELPVRLKAAQILSQLSRQNSRRTESKLLVPKVPFPIPKAEPPKPPPLPPEQSPRPPSGSAPPARLTVQLPPGTWARVLVNGTAQELISGKEYTLPAGHYRIRTSCGETPQLELRSGEKRADRLCESAVVDQIRLLRQAGKLDDAQQALDRLLGQLKGRESSPLYDRARFERGELLAARGQLDKALEVFNAVWERYLNRPSGEIQSIEQKFAVLRGKVGRLSVYDEVKGRCVLISDSLHLAGRVLNTARVREVLIRAGEHNRRSESCRSGRP